MKITKIDIKGFGKFENAVFLPEPGLNIFYGANEAGKSTIQAFIKAMFYGLKSGRRTKEGAVNERKRFKPWFGKAFGGMLEYRLDNGLKYTVGRNFENNTLTVYDEFSNNITGEFPADKEAIAKFAEQHLGLSGSVFERTVFLGQMQSAVNREGRKILAERLINLKESGDEQVSFKAAVNALKQALITHVGSERTTTRPINLLNGQLQEALEDEKKARELHKMSAETFRELEKTQKEAGEYKEQLNQLVRIRSELHKNEEIRILYVNHKKLIECLEQIKQIESKIKETEERKEHLARELEDLKGFADFTRDDADRMIEDNIRYKMLLNEKEELIQSENATDDKITATETELVQYSLFNREGHRIQEALETVLKHDNTDLNAGVSENGKLSAKKKMSAVCIFLSIILLPAIVFLRAGIPELYHKALIACDVLFFLVSVLFWALLKRKTNRIRTQKGDMQDFQNLKQLLKEWMEEADVANIHDLVRLKSMYDSKLITLAELRSGKEDLEKDRIDLEIQLEGVRTVILNRLKKACLCENEDTFDENDITSWKKGIERYMLVFPMYESMEKEMASFVEKAENIYRHAGLILGVDIRNREQMEKAIEELNDRLGDQQPVAENESPGLSVIDEKIEELRNKINDCDLRISALTSRLENVPDEETLQKAFEKVQVLKEEKENLLSLGKAMEIAISVLTEASVAIQRDYVPGLSRELNSYLSVITGGLYDNVMADDNLNLNVLPGEATERILPEQLSSGTIDQVYMALRLAVVRLIEKDSETVPLFFDEPFSQYDEERTENALRLLIKESRHRQIFIFTCKTREVELAKKMMDNGTVNIVYLSPSEPIFSQQS